MTIAAFATLACLGATGRLAIAAYQLHAQQQRIARSNAAATQLPYLAASAPWAKRFVGGE